MKYYIFYILIFFYTGIASSQTLVTANDPVDQVVRMMSLNDSTDKSLFRSMYWIEETGSTRIGLSSRKHKEFFLHPIKTSTHFNSKYAKSFNDGSVWAGKGISSWISGGLSFKSKTIELTLVPEFTYSQNEPFNIPSAKFNSSNVFLYPWYSGIDFPQRFGHDPFTKLYLGQSRLKYTFKNRLYVKFSNENMWWGPVYHNSILMTNTAPGMPHVSIGSDQLLGSKIGHFGFGLYWGRLQESDYYDNNGVDAKFFSGTTFEYHPSFIEGLVVGFGRILYRSWNRKSRLKDYLLFLRQFSVKADSTGANDEYDQLASLYVRWRFPEVGFETFLEYARNDFGGDLKNLLISQPDHSRFYSFGFAKMMQSSLGDIRFSTEFTTLSRSDTKLIRASPVLYVHNIGGGGYTNHGQLIGAPVGPGSNSQSIIVDVLRDNSKYGVKLQRISFNDDFFFQNAPSDPNLARDVETSLGFDANWTHGKNSLGAKVTMNVRNNWNYTKRGDVLNLFLRFDFSRAF